MMPLKSLYAIFSIIICLILPGCGKKVKVFPKVEQMAKEYAWYINPEYIADEHIYFYLRDSMSIEDLRTLTDYPTPLVRTYCFTALVERQDSAIFQILLRHLRDTAPIEVYYPGQLYGSTVADKMISTGLKFLNKQERDSLRDLIIFKHHYLETTKEIFIDMIPNDKYYNMVRKLAQQDYDVTAYVALATYRRQEDIPLIKSSFNNSNINHYYIFKSIDNFPDTAFFPVLLQHFDTFDYKHGISYSSHYYYIRALAQYQCKECLDIFESMSKYLHYYYEGSASIRDQNKAHILQAINRYYCPLYEELRNELDSTLSEVSKSNAKVDEQRAYERSLWWQ